MAHLPAGLGTWVARQRHAWKAGRLPPVRQQQLAALGFCCDAFQESWAAHFRQLAAFHSQHGHCRVPCAAWARQRHPGLYDWLQQQAHQWRQGTLPDDRRRRLEGVGVVFRAAQSAWEQRFEELLLFQQARRGLHCNRWGVLRRQQAALHQVLLCSAAVAEGGGGVGPWEWGHALQQPLVSHPTHFQAAGGPLLPVHLLMLCCRSLGTPMCRSSGLATPP